MRLRTHAPLALVVLVGLGALGAGCGMTVERANAKALVRDAQILLGRARVPPVGLSCRMQGTTRCGGCSVVLDAAAKASLTSSLALAPAPAGGAADAGHGACSASPALHGRSGLTVLQVADRPASLELPDGGAFTHLVLYLDETTGESCLHVCYAYG